MGTAENAKIQFESGQDLVAFAMLVDQGDHKAFRSDDQLWSNRGGYEPEVKPNGLATGGVITPANSGDDDAVDVAALSCFVSGLPVIVLADTDVGIVRAVSGGTPFKKSSITVKAGAIVVVAGLEGAAFSVVRGAAGGPPLIPLADVEIGQVWTSSVSGDQLLVTEIKQVIGTTTEMYNYPTWQQVRFNVQDGIAGNAGIDFDAPLPLIHSASSPGSAQPKEVFVQYYTPTFSDIAKTEGFVPAETSHSISSKQIYGMTIGASAQSLGQGAFTAFLEDGISDGLLKLKNENLFFKFYQNRLNAYPFILGQGKLGISRTFPAGDQITAACTISSETAFAEVVG